jgi:hypothetical protein
VKEDRKGHGTIVVTFLTSTLPRFPRTMPLRLCRTSCRPTAQQAAAAGAVGDCSRRSRPPPAQHAAAATQQQQAGMHAASSSRQPSNNVVARISAADRSTPVPVRVTTIAKVPNTKNKRRHKACNAWTDTQFGAPAQRSNVSLGDLRRWYNIRVVTSH